MQKNREEAKVRKDIAKEGQYEKREVLALVRADLLAINIATMDLNNNTKK